MWYGVFIYNNYTIAAWLFYLFRETVSMPSVIKYAARKASITEDRKVSSKKLVLALKATIGDLSTLVGGEDIYARTNLRSVARNDN